MLLSLNLEDSLLFIVPFVITAIISVALFLTAAGMRPNDKPMTWLRIALVVLGMLFLIAALGIGACFGIMWDFHLDVR